jgi:hypothetical protein
MNCNGGDLRRCRHASFATQKTFATGPLPISVALGDVNGDGKPDLLVANYGGNTVSVLLNTTPPGAITPSFATQQTFATGNKPIKRAKASRRSARNAKVRTGTNHVKAIGYRHLNPNQSLEHSLTQRDFFGSEYSKQNSQPIEIKRVAYFIDIIHMST